MSDCRASMVGRGGEGQLLTDHGNGDREAFRELVERYRGPVYSYLVRSGVASEDRDDLFQEVFLRVHRGAPTYQPGLPLHPWLFTIVANTVRTYHRRHRVQQLVRAQPPTIDPPAPDPDSQRSAEARETVAWLEGEIARLPVLRREVLLLVGLEGMALKETAKALGLPLGSVKTHLRRARITLAEALARRNQGEVVP